MKTLAGMSEVDIKTYLNLIARATREVTPPDAHFVLCLFGPDNATYYVSDCRRLEMPAALRELADRMAADMARQN